TERARRLESSRACVQPLHLGRSHVQGARPRWGWRSREMDWNWTSGNFLCARTAAKVECGAHGSAHTTQPDPRLGRRQRKVRRLVSRLRWLRKSAYLDPDVCLPFAEGRHAAGIVPPRGYAGAPFVVRTEISWSRF